MKKRSVLGELFYWLCLLGIVAAILIYFYRHTNPLSSNSDAVTMLVLCCLCAFILFAAALLRYLRGRKKLVALLLVPALALSLPAGCGIGALIYGPKVKDIGGFILANARQNRQADAEISFIRALDEQALPVPDGAPVIRAPFAVAERYSEKDEWRVWEQMSGHVESPEAFQSDDFTQPTECRTLILIEPNPERFCSSNYEWSDTHEAGSFVRVTATIIDVENQRRWAAVDFSMTPLRRDYSKYDVPYMYPNNIYHEGFQEYQAGDFARLLEAYWAD